VPISVRGRMVTVSCQFRQRTEWSTTQTSSQESYKKTETSKPSVFSLP